MAIVQKVQQAYARGAGIYVVLRSTAFTVCWDGAFCVRVCCSIARMGENPLPGVSILAKKYRVNETCALVGLHAVVEWCAGVRVMCVKNECMHWGTMKCVGVLTLMCL